MPMPRLFTPEQDATIAAEYAAGASLVDLAQKWGGSQGSIDGAVRRGGGAIRARRVERAIPADVREKIVSSYAAGGSVNSLYTDAGLSPSIVRRVLDEEGVDRRDHAAACRVRGSGEYALDDRYFERLDTAEKCRIVGFTGADGCVLDGNGNGRFRRMFLKWNVAAVDREHLESIRAALGAEHPVRDYLNGEDSYGGPRPMACLAIGSVRLCEDLIRHGITPRKTHTLVPPSLPDGLARHFWAGMIDGDGWLSHNPESSTRCAIGLCGASEVAIRAYVDFVQRAVGFRPHFRRDGNICRAVTQGIRRVQALTRLFYRDLDGAFPLARKAALADAVLADSPRKKCWSHLTPDVLVSLYFQHGTNWLAVGRALAMKTASHIHYYRKLRGVPLRPTPSTTAPAQRSLFPES